MFAGFVRRGGWWVAGQFALIGAVVAGGILGHGEGGHAGWRSAALGFWGLGALCGIAGARALGRALTPYPSPIASGQFVQHGIYGWMRHPLYTAVICGALGWVLFRQSWPALVAAAGLAWLLDAKARREEEWLKERYPGYGDYQRRVRRFIPGVY